jgi:potassium efflux system protein
VTGRLVNWSLSNPMLRVIIPVGVAYGSDSRMVQETLLRLAERCKRVLKQPPPQVWFVSFGDSALMFEARVYIAGIEDLLPVRDDLHHAIASTFREKRIEIAFPQQDIHIRSIAAPLTVQGETLPAALQEQ